VPVGGIGVEVGCAALDTCVGCAVLAGACLLAEDALVAQCASQPEGLYTVDRKIDDFDTQLEERIASAGAAGYEAPANRRANRIFVDGKSLRFADDERFGTPTVTACSALGGAFVAVPGYTDVAGCGDLRDGVALGTAESGVQRVIFQGHQAELLVDGTGVGRYPPTAGTSLTAAEVRLILARALEVAERTRAQIRQPLGTNARVSISVVDTTGAVLGIVRSVDAPVFGIDVSLQKARTAAFFSSPSARSSLETTNVAVAGVRRGGRRLLHREGAVRRRRNRARGRSHRCGGVHRPRERKSLAPVLPRRHQRQWQRAVLAAVRAVEPVLHGAAARPRANRHHRDFLPGQYAHFMRRRRRAPERHPDLSRQRADLPRHDASVAA
jgi:hypothetical protein